MDYAIPINNKSPCQHGDITSGGTLYLPIEHGFGTGFQDIKAVCAHVGDAGLMQPPRVVGNVGGGGKAGQAGCEFATVAFSVFGFA